MKTFKCYICFRVLPLTMFYKNKRTKNGINGVCKTCCAKKQREDNSRDDRVMSRVEKTFLLGAQS